jgi:hypothetical protein
MNQKMNDVYQVNLQTTHERQIFVQKLAMDNLPFLSSLPAFCPTQGHPIEAFGTHSDIYLTN